MKKFVTCLFLLCLIQMFTCSLKDTGDCQQNNKCTSPIYDTNTDRRQYYKEIGTDCWAGNGEAFTCSKGYSYKMTGKSKVDGKDVNNSEDMTWLEYTCCKSKLEKITPDCDQKLCTKTGFSYEGDTRKECWAGNGLAYTCGLGYSFRMTGKTMVDDGKDLLENKGKTWLEYTCCKTKEEPEKISKTNCSEEQCTAPDGKGGKDCWSGNGEDYTCGLGYSFKMTGKSSDFDLNGFKGNKKKTSLEYTCCANTASAFAKFSTFMMIALSALML